jgi:AcrR family transcriptional regulator
MSFLGDEPRERLIAAAAELCAELGYDEMLDEEIAARAGLPAEALRRHFPGGKEECLLAAENAILLEVVAAVSRSYAADRPEWESVIRGVEAILELMAENPGFAYLGYIFSRQMASGPVREVNEGGHRMVEAMLERGWEYSQGGDQPAKTALGVLGGAQAIVRRELVAGRAAQLPQILPDCVYIATVPFLGQREALRLAGLARERVDASA